MRRAAFLLAILSCTPATQLRVERDPELVTTPGMRVSVFGVFHDGRMSEPAWTTLSSKVSGALGRTFCETGYSADLREANPDLMASIDHDVRENGIDDAVLERVAPSAAADLVMVLMSYRKLPEHKVRPATSAAPPPRAPAMGGRMSRAGFGRSSGPVPSAEDDRVFELSASFYSRKARKLVAQVELRYDGDDLDEAMDAFAKKLTVLLPDAKCVGWHWQPAQPPAAQDSNAPTQQESPPKTE